MVHLPPAPVQAELAAAVRRARGQNTIVSHDRILDQLSSDLSPATVAWIASYSDQVRALTNALKNQGLTVHTKLRGGRVNAWVVPE